MNHAQLAPVPLVEADANGLVVWANPAATPLLEAWQTGVGSLLPSSEADRVALVAANGTELRVDQVVGERVWTLHLCADPDSDHVLITAQDRSAQAAAERRLMVADRAPALHPEPILRVTAEGVLTWLNSAAVPIAARWGVVAGEQVPAEWARSVARVIQEGAGHTEVFEHDSGVWSLRLLPDVGGQAVYLFGNSVDRSPAHEPGPAQDNFVANMGHELRTPLNAILGYTELVQDDLRADGRDQAVADLDKVRASAGRLRAMIDGMVDLAKLQAGRITLKPSRFEVADLVDDVVFQAATDAERNGNSLAVQLELDATQMQADVARVRQILGALLDNACKFTQGGQIHLRVCDAVHEARPAAAFHLTDTGIGMSAEDLAGLFRPYAQRDGSATRKYGGTGLGLAIARMLARRMGGDIAVRSELDHGSTFTLTLPLEPGSP